jgi:hypothetical protein
MRLDPAADKVILSKEDYTYYQQLRKEARVYGTDEFNQRSFRSNNKNKYHKKRY